MAIDENYPLLYTSDMDMDEETFYSLPVRKRHLLERKRDRLWEKRLPLMDEIMRLRHEIEKLEEEAGIGQPERVEKSCAECCSISRYDARIYNRDKIHYLDGDRSNKSHSNIAIICPRCASHIILSPFTPKDIWELKMKGLSNAAIGKYLGLSRERVRQLCKRYQPEPVQSENIDIDELVKEAQNRERRYGHNRITDKRTLRKRIIRELTKLGKKQREAHNERSHRKEG